MSICLNSLYSPRSFFLCPFPKLRFLGQGNRLPFFLSLCSSLHSSLSAFTDLLFFSSCKHSSSFLLFFFFNSHSQNRACDNWERVTSQTLRSVSYKHTVSSEMMRCKAEMEKVFSSQHFTLVPILIKQWSSIPWTYLCSPHTCFPSTGAFSNILMSLYCKCSPLQYTKPLLCKSFAFCIRWLVGALFVVLLLWFAKQFLLNFEYTRPFDSTTITSVHSTTGMLGFSGIHRLFLLY